MRNRLGIVHGTTGRGAAMRAGLAGACSLTLALAACGDGGIFGGAGDDAPVVTETTTIGAEEGNGGGDGGDGGPNPTAGTTTTTTTTTIGRDGDGNGGGSGGGDCGVDEDAAVISESIAGVDGPEAGDYWELAETNFDPCGELTYALFQQMPQGSSQFATKILMFHDGEYLGVDSTHPQQAKIVGEGDGWFEVEYRDWEALRDSGEANAAAPNYTSNVTFTWSEGQGRVSTDGRFPNTGL